MVGNVLHGWDGTRLIRAEVRRGKPPYLEKFWGNLDTFAIAFSLSSCEERSNVFAFKRAVWEEKLRRKACTH